MLFERLMLASRRATTPPVGGILYAIGDNAAGAAGQNTGTGNVLTPTVVVDGHTNWTKIVAGPAIAAGGAAVFGLLSNGTLWSWGSNNAGGTNGSIGQGNNNNPYYVPTQIGSVSTWTDVSASKYGGLAVRSDGTLWSWGVDAQGELGRGGGYANAFVPTQIGVATIWSKVFCGQYASFMIDTSGHLWTMGTNSFYATGRGINTGSTLTPTQIGSATNWSSVAAVGLGGIALRTDGTAWSWGTSSYGELMQGATGSFPNPTQIGVLTNWAFVAGATFGSAQCGFLIQDISGSRTLWTAGSNQSYQTGRGINTGNTLAVRQVGSAANWKKVTTSNQYVAGNNDQGGAVAIQTDGTAWSWGGNASGKTGQGTASGTTNNPTQIGVATYWQDLCVATGSSTIFLIK